MLMFEGTVSLDVVLFRMPDSVYSHSVPGVSNSLINQADTIVCNLQLRQSERNIHV